MSVWTRQEQLDAELLDTLQQVRQEKRLPLHVRTRENSRKGSSLRPGLRCAYCGRKQCIEHDDLPALDPYFKETS